MRNLKRRILILSFRVIGKIVKFLSKGRQVNEPVFDNIRN